jgi:hypothetical protein
VLVAAALVGMLAGRSDTIHGLRGDGLDERLRMSDLRASAIAGFAVIVGFLVEVAEGRSGNPYAWLAAIGGSVYLASIWVLRARS